MSKKIRITVWNEFRHEKSDERVKSIYPEGIHHTIAQSLAKNTEFEVSTATLDEPEHGLTESVLDNTDVLFWWGHKAHEEVQDEIVKKIQTRVLAGMGLIVLHSGHYSKIFKALMGTNCSLKWRESGERERLWNIAPGHPITKGIGDYIELPEVEMYGERFDIPEPEKVIFISWFEGGEVFRSGAIWERGYGRIFYFRPGHETYPIYHDKSIQQVLANAASWAQPRILSTTDNAENVAPLENLE